MGVLRVLLALSVALSHLGDYTWTGLAGGFAAVQMFYLISGFYMATILTEKYDPRTDLAVFYSNRFLRIYSIYFVSLLISLAAYGVIHAADLGGWWDYVSVNVPKVDWLGRAWLALTSVIIVGQESTLFLELKDGALAFTPNGPVGDTPVWIFMPVPQAWSISLELMFYALVPFLIRLRTGPLIAIVAASLALRLAIYAAGYATDPWLSRFFPNELALFVMGMLARRLYDGRLAALDGRLQLAIAFAFLLLAGMWRTIFLQFDTLHTVWVLYACGLIAVPCLFHVTRFSRLDRTIGNLSYPLYLIHWIVVTFYDAFTPRWGLPPAGSSARVAICIAAALALSYLIMVSVEVPLDRYRQRRAAALA